jgi:hypothetical protein
LRHVPKNLAHPFQSKACGSALRRWSFLPKTEQRLNSATLQGHEEVWINVRQLGLGDLFKRVPELANQVLDLRGNFFRASELISRFAN